MAYKITAKRNVMIADIRKKLLSGETYISEKETRNMKNAKQAGLIDYVEVKSVVPVPKEAAKPPADKTAKPPVKPQVPGKPVQEKPKA